MAVARTPKDDSDIALGRLGNYLGFRLRRVQNQLSRDFQTRAAGWNMRAGMFSSMEVIASNPGLSQAELSAEVGLDKSAIVPLVDDLEARGWVERTRSPHDRRRNELKITKLGRTELDKMFAVLDETEHDALAALTMDERDTINAALDKVYHAYVRGST